MIHTRNTRVSSIVSSGWPCEGDHRVKPPQVETALLFAARGLSGGFFQARPGPRARTAVLVLSGPLSRKRLAFSSQAL
jgi:hypothetical protein